MWDLGIGGLKYVGSGISEKMWDLGFGGVKKCGIWDSGGEKMWDLGFGYPCKPPPLRSTSEAV